MAEASFDIDQLANDFVQRGQSMGLPEMESNPAQLAPPRNVGQEWQQAGRMALEYGLPTVTALGGGILGTLVNPGVGTAIGAGIGGVGGSALVDLLLGRPVSKTSAAIQGIASAFGGPAGSGTVKAALRLPRAMRPLTKDLAREEIAAKLMTPEALAAKQFYTEASARTSSFTQAQSVLDKLRGAASALEKQGKTAEASQVWKQIEFTENAIERAFPGFKEAQTGYHRLKSVGRAQELTERSNPLSILEKDLAKGQVTGATGAPLVGSKGAVSRHFSAAENNEIRDILAKLGPEPGEGIWKKMIAGHAIGAAGGMLLGGSPYAGGVVGGATAHLGPMAINKAITSALQHPVTRAFLKRSLQGGNLANPQFWQVLGNVGARLGIEGFIQE